VLEGVEVTFPLPGIGLTIPSRGISVSSVLPVLPPAVRICPSVVLEPDDPVLILLPL
jgi:hypothetical protein